MASNLEKRKKGNADQADRYGQASAAGAFETAGNGHAGAGGAVEVVRDTTPHELEEVPRKTLEVSMGLHKLITLVLSPIYARAGLELKPVSAHNAIPRLMLLLVTPPGQDLVNALALRGVEGAFGDGNKLTAAGATAVAKACAAGLMMAGLGNSTHLFNLGGNLTPGKLEMLVKSINEDKVGIASKLNLSESEIDRAKRAGLGLLMIQVAFSRDKWLEFQQHQDIYDSWAADNPGILPVIQSGTTVPDAAVRYFANRYPFLQLPAAQAEFGPFLSLAVLKAYVAVSHGAPKIAEQPGGASKNRPGSEDGRTIRLTAAGLVDNPLHASRTPLRNSSKMTSGFITNAIVDGNGHIQFGYQDDSEPGGLKIVPREELDIIGNNLQRVIILRTALLMGHDNVVIRNDGEVYAVRSGKGPNYSYDRIDVSAKFTTVAESITAQIKSIVFDSKIYIGSIYGIRSDAGCDETRSQNARKRSRIDFDESEDDPAAVGCSGVY